MKKNGYVRRFLALFLTLVMIMADSSVTTFAATVGMVSTQSLNYVDVRLNAPDGTYYVAAMKDNGSWYEAKSQVAEVEVTGGYADTTLSVSDISDAQIVLLRLKQGSYSQNYDQSNYAVIKSNNILDYTKKVSGGEINGDAAEINVTTIGNTTVSDVYGSLGSATNYAVFAGTFYNAGDMEGNIATDSFHSDGSDIGDSGNVGQYTERLKIHTTKTVSGLKDTETFKFGLFDSNDKLVQVKALTFSKDGTQSFNFDTIELGSSSGTGSSSYKYSVYELEESKSGQYTYGSGKYNKVSNTYKDFTVSYSENTAIEIFNNDNYVKTASGTVKLRDGNLYTTSKSGEISISGQVNNVKYGLSDSEFTSRVTNGEYSSGGVSAMINGKLKTLARDLGTAKSGNGTQVIYITPNVLTGNSVYLPYNGNILADSAEKLVINMIVPDGITELDLLGGDIGIVDVGGTNIKDGKNWSKAGLNIVWNYIKEDGTPFNGTVKLGGGQLPGIQLLPDGTLYSGNNVSQLDVAKILHQIGGEIHKAPIQGERTAYVNISNTGASGTYTPVVKKELSGRELKEGEFSFTIAEVDSAGNAVTGGYTDTKSNAADGTVTFDTITYTTAKTYYYKVIEKVPENKLPGVTYTTDSYIITVTVTNNGNGTLNASADKGLDNLVFHNSYTSKKTGITFSGTKTLEGKTLEAGKFTFVLQETDKNWKAKDGKAAVTATNGENGAYSFGKIEYTEAGTYYYTVSEQGKGTTVEGITYDATEYKITVTVTDDGKGNLVAKADREVNNLDFKNSYSSQKTGITFSGTKTLEGKTLEAGKFTFVLQETDKNWKAKDGKAAVTATNGENGAYSFGKIEYTEAGTYYYTVSEQGKGTTVDGITYDATEYKITVTVTDAGKGKLVAKADREVNNLNFKNTYSSQKTEITFSGTKTLEGKTLEAGKFTFVLQETDKNWKAKDGKAAVTATNGENGAYSFGKIEYTEAGTYYYTVSEQGKGTTVDGITYDATEYKITVTVTDAGKGKLVAKADREVNNLNFKNTYSSQKTEITFSGTKTLEGKTLEAGKFTFVLQETDKNWKAKDGKAAVTATNGENGAYSFGKIEYTEAGTYYYTVSEQGKGTTVEGITYDATEYKITVTVTDDGKGNLVAKADREVNNLDFKNSYSSQKTEITFSGTKTLEGKTLEAGKFTFVLQETDKNWKAKDGKAAVTATNGENGAYSFGKIEYTEAGTYYYTVSEQGKGTTVEGITYDATEYKITVTVTDDGKGNLVASADRKVDELNFTNTYKATGSTTLTATKTLTGRSFQSGDNWTFTVTASPTTAPMPEHPVITTSATSGNSETLNFGKINYTLKDVGTYVYTITESGNVTNVENDPNTARTVKVIVTDNGDGTLKVEQIEDAKNGLTFTNKYAEGETTLGVTKVLSGREFKDGDAWTFNLTADSETAPMPAETSVTTTATSGNSQSLTFGTIKYSLADVGNTYTYTITESGSGEGVTNDPNATRTVTVTVAEGSDGKLAITRTESEGGTVFTNIYNATGSLTLEANKKLKNKTLAAGAFSFELKELTAENTKVLETIPNEADGSVNFTTINYTLADVGTHTYTVSEVKGDDGTVTYDGTIYTVEATVTDAGNGTLNVSKVIKKNGEKVDSIDFTNTYVGEIEIAGTKTWNDNNDQEGIRPTSITVNLFANGEKVKDQKVTPDGNGNWNYKFEKLPEYNENGKITYTVTEDAVEGYTTELDGNNFINTHVPETTEISGTKTWNDAEDQDGKRPESITVKLLANGEEVNSQTVTAGEDGSWNYSFTNLPKFANGQEITYTVSETPVEDYTTTYDDNDIINSYTPGQTSATITKIWADADNQDGIRPESITVTLLADGKETGTTATLTAANNWTETITGLPEKANRKAIEYTWAEKDLPDGYELTDNSTDGTVTTLTNTHTTAVTSLSGTKTWEDADNQDGKRPESIIINLFADGKQIENKTVKADALGNWAYSFTNLPKFANGKEIVYTVTEDAVEGYTTKVDGNNFINSYKPETTEVSGTKNWNDAEDQDGKRPESITVRLLANGVEKDSQTVKADEAGSWTYKFTNLPKYEAGEEIVYTVTEDAVPDYTTEISGYDITNSYAPGKTSVTVTKAWVDNNNRDNHRPDAIKVQLKADGVSSGEEITLNAENNWTYTWSDLDQKKAGKDIAYTVEETGKAAGYISTVTGNAEEGFIITNTITSVKISKVDITDQKELAGAHIQVIDKDGNVVEEWDSTWEAHEVTGLKPGETYTLRETVAPEGYTLTSDTTFTLKEDGTVNKDTTTTTISDNGTLLVEDSRTSVKVSKVDISDGKELEGAHIQIIDQDGNVVDEWDSTKEAHVTEKLKTGKIYTLRETVAPDGYLLTSDTTFVLKEDGTVDAEKTTAVSKDGVLLVQDKLATAASIAVTKKLTYIGENLAARDQTFYVALYSDKECTQRVSDVKALVFKNADASTVVFSENIKAGKTYYIAECTQDGTSQTIGALADGTVYEAVFGNGNSTTVTEANGTTTVSFENVFSSFPPDGFYKQGQLTITKKVLGADGGTRNSNEVFYAGIFDDAAHTQLSQQVEQNIIKLDMDGGYEVSEIINVGLAQSGAKVTLYVTETDSNGKPIAGSEGFGYKVTVSADSVTLDETNMTAEVVITNQEESTVTETPTPTPSSDGGNSGGSENHSGGYGGGKSPKTGDDTPIGTYLMLLLAAAMLAAETERRRRRNKRQ